MSSEVAAAVLEFYDRRFPFRTPGGPFWGLSVGKAYLFAPNSITFLQVTLISSDVAMLVSEFSGSRFPIRTAGGLFWSLSVGKAYVFAPNSLTVSAICEPSVRTGYSHLERSGRAGFRFFWSAVPFLQVTLISSDVAMLVSEFSGSRFPIRTAGGLFWSLSVGKAYVFAPNSLTVSAICEPSVRTGYSHLERSSRAGVGILGTPVLDPDRRRAVLEPKCWKRVHFPHKLPNRESYLQAVSSYRFPFWTPGGPIWGLSVGKASLFAPNSLTVSPICEPSVPTGYSHLERSSRAGVGILGTPVLYPDRRRAVLEPKRRKRVPFPHKLPNRESYLQAVSSYRFPFWTPGGPFWGLRVGNAYLFAPNSLTVSPICEPPVPTGYSHLERSGRASFGIFRSQVTLISNEVAVPAFYFSGRQFPFRTPGGPFWSVSVGKASLFTPNSLTVSPICEPSVSTGYSRLERSDRAGFGIFRSPVPDPDPRRPVLEPKCRKGVPFRPKHPNRESYLRAVSSYRLHSCCVKRPCQFYNYSERRFPFRTPDGPFWGRSVGKAYLFAPNSLTVGPICEPPVPPGYSHLERSGRAGFGNFRSPVPDPDPRRAVLEPRFPFRTPGGPFWGLSVGKAYLFAPNSLTVSPVCEPPVPTGYSNLERSGRAGFAIFRSPVPNPDPQRAVLKPKCRKSVPFRPKLPNLTLISNEVAVPVSEFFGRRFPIRTPGGPFWSLSVGKECLFAPNSLTVSPFCKPLVPTGYTHVESEFSGRRFPFRTPGGPFWNPSVGKEYLFAPNSLTVSPIYEPPIPTGNSHLERSGYAGFGIFRSPVPDPDLRLAVLEPKCRKSIPFRPKHPNRESYLRAVSSYRLHSCRAKWPRRF
ncbi:hypothetical protein MRB53_013037 [Persea americana]|nr:hypothetical protein MRB53_013037 [Persea americana]